MPPARTSTTAASLSASTAKTPPTTPTGRTAADSASASPSPRASATSTRAASAPPGRTALSPSPACWDEPVNKNESPWHDTAGSFLGRPASGVPPGAAWDGSADSLLALRPPVYHLVPFGTVLPVLFGSFRAIPAALTHLPPPFIMYTVVSCTAAGVFYERGSYL